MDRKLLNLLCSPDATRQSLNLLDTAGLEALNRAISQGNVLRADGSVQTEALSKALISFDRKQVYRIDDGIPVLLAEEAIATTQIANFPRK